MKEIKIALYKHTENKTEAPFTHTMNIAKYNKYKPQIEAMFKGHKVEYNFSRNEATISIL